MKKTYHRILANLGQLALLSVIGTGLSACSHRAATKPPAESAPEPTRSPMLTDEIRARLSEADAADGKEDHVISKCVTCNLKMAGNPAFTSVVGNYRMQLCSAGCKALFERDRTKELLALRASGH